MQEYKVKGTHRDAKIPAYRNTEIQGMDTELQKKKDTRRQEYRNTGIHRAPSEIQGYRGTQGILRNIGKQGYPLPRPPSLLRKTGILEYQQRYWDTNRDIGIPGTTYRDTQRDRGGH